MRAVAFAFPTAAAIALAALLLQPGSARASSLYDDLGAKPGVTKLVAEATAIFTSDPRIAPIFEESNMDRIREKLAEQICSLADGGCTYTGHEMRASHRGLHLQTRDFNAMVEDLQQAMDHLSIPFPTQNRLLARLAPLYRDVVSR
ncbi:MAG: group 1 truncated hemoglobin [Acetobacteraceae bacterium]|nr:group 1 truncated hemoglobin [Acetobacteraceae bacterium]